MTGLSLSLALGLSDVPQAATWFSGMDLAWDFTQSTLYGAAAEFTDTHANPIVTRNAAGLAISKGANELCRTDMGHFVLPARTQLYADPTDIAGTLSSNVGTGTITQNTVDPAGASNKAWTLNDTSAAATYSRQRNWTVPNDSLNRLISVFVKKTTGAPATWPAVSFGYTGGTPKNSRAVINTTTGEFVRSSTSATWWTEDWGDFWRIVGAISNNSTGNTTFFLSIYPAEAQSHTTTIDVAAVGPSIFAWPTFELADFPAMPILDDITAGGNIVTTDVSAYEGQAFTGFVELDLFDPGSGSIRPLTFGTATDHVAIAHGSGRVLMKAVVGGVEQASVNIGPWPYGGNGTRVGIAFAFGPNYVWGQLVRGHAVTADTSASFPDISTVCLGGLSDDTSERRAFVAVRKLALKFGAADADSAAQAYARAVSALGTPTFWDNFDRADGLPGVSPSGHTYLQVAAGSNRVLANIVSKTLVAADTGGATTAAYTVVDLGRPARRVRGRVAFQGAAGAGLGLLLTKTYTPADSQYIVNDGAIHPVFTDIQDIFGFYALGVLTNLDTIRYPNDLPRNESIYEFGYDLDGDNVTIYHPYQAPMRLSDPRFSQYNGRYVTFEHFWSSTQGHPYFTYIEAD